MAGLTTSERWASRWSAPVGERAALVASEPQELPLPTILTDLPLYFHLGSE